MDSHQHLVTLGLPCIRNEPEEVREFLPELVHVLANAGARILLEDGYGSRMGYRMDDYLSDGSTIEVVDRAAAFSASIVVMLRPSDDALEALTPGATFVSMLHFPTHKGRARELKERGIEGVALDLIVNDEDDRLVENMRAVAWNGLDAAFGVLEQIRPDFARRDRDPTRVTIIGAGLVGKNAVEAATKYGSLDRLSRLACDCIPGVEVTTIGRNLSGDEAFMKRLLGGTDVLVDATARHQTDRPVVPSAWLPLLPQHAVITDLSVDPYLLDEDPPVVKGIEGIPGGDLRQQVFAPDDPAWDEVPVEIPRSNRRWVVSCYSWPGIDPVACMRRYGNQLEPLLQTLVARGGAEFLRADGGLCERALYRGSLRAWVDRI